MEYTQVKELRAGGGEATFVAIEGYPIEQWETVVAESSTLTLPGE